MTAQEIYKKETGLSATNIINYKYTNDYINWLQKTVEKQHEPTILKWIKEMFEHAEKKKWFETYWSFDIHGTISKPDYRKDNKEIIYYPYAKETLKILSERKDIIMIMNTSSYPDELEIYKKQFKNDNINFNYFGENPEVTSAGGSFGYYKTKFYFNVEFEDKAGFDPKRDWKFLYEYFLNTEYRPNENWSTKTNEDYHK